MCSQSDDPSTYLALPTEPTPEATEALATALLASGLMRRLDEYARHAYPATMFSAPLDELAQDWTTHILAALPPGTVLTTVDDVARRLREREVLSRLGYRAEAKRLLGLTE